MFLRSLLVSSCAVTAFCLFGSNPAAAAAGGPRVFRLGPQPVDQAIVQFALQAGVSVGGFPAPGCAGRSHVVVGLMAPAVALRHLLPTGCAFETIDARTFRIIAVRVARAPPPSVARSIPAAPAVDELVVTAEKRQEPLIGSAFAVSALPSAELRRLGGHSFSDIALQMAGVAVTNLGSGRNKIFVRGLSDGSFTGQTQSTVGLYLDDVPITYSAPDPDLRLADVDQVEVLRGPQGTLYGSGSIGGIVRIVTVRPDPSELSGSATVEAATGAHGVDSNGAEAILNLPLGARSAVRAVGYRDVRGGYIDNVRLGRKDVNKSTRSGWRVSSLNELPNGWRVQGSYAHQSIDSRDSQYVLEDGQGLTRDNAVREPHDNDFTELGLTAARAGPVVDLKFSLAFIDHSFDSRFDATGALGAVGPAAFDDSRSVDLWVAEAVATSASAGRTRWLAGVFASRADEAEDAALTELTLSRVRHVYLRRDRLTEAAVYGELSRDIGARWSVTAGARLFNNRQSSRMDGFDLAGVGRVTGALSDQGFAPKLRVSYAFRPDTVAYVQVQEGYRTGGFNLPSEVVGQSAGAGTGRFRPDRLRSYEAGIQSPLLARTASVRVAVFHAQWRALQSDQYLASGLPMTINIGDGDNTGVEAEAVWRPDDHWQVRGNLLVENPQLTRPGSNFPATADMGLPGVASIMGSADVRYSWRPRDGVLAEVSAQYGHIGHSFLTFDGGASSRMGGYGVARVAASLEGQSWRLETFVDNLTDVEGNTFAFGNPFSRARAAQSTPVRPRSFGAAVTRRF